MSKLTFNDVINPSKVYCINCKYGHFLGNWNWQWYESYMPSKNEFVGFEGWAKIQATLKITKNENGNCESFKERTELKYKIKKLYKRFKRKVGI